MAKGCVQDVSVKVDINNVLLCSPKELYLGVDGLYDFYSHTGKAITSSPHYELMDACSKNKLSESIYIHLENIGALDSRDSFRKKSEKHLAEFHKAKLEIENNTYNPVLFYVIDGNRYIYDGKHRAALCGYLGLKVKCVEINPHIVCSKYYIHLYGDMEKYPERYSKLQRKLVKTITADINT